MTDFPFDLSMHVMCSYRTYVILNSVLIQFCSNISKRYKHRVTPLYKLAARIWQQFSGIPDFTGKPDEDQNR